jgi:hypothetical protein
VPGFKPHDEQVTLRARTVYSLSGSGNQVEVGFERTLGSSSNGRVAIC